MTVLAGVVGCIAGRARIMQRCWLVRWQRHASIWVPRLRRAGHVAILAGFVIAIGMLGVDERRADRLVKASPLTTTGTVADSGARTGQAPQRWDVTVADLPDPGPIILPPQIGFRDLVDLTATPAAAPLASGTAGGGGRGAGSASAVQISPAPAATAVAAAAAVVIGLRQVRRRTAAPSGHDPGFPSEHDKDTGDLDQEREPADTGTDTPGPSAAETGTPPSAPVDGSTDASSPAAAGLVTQDPPMALPGEDTPQSQEPHAAPAGAAGALPDTGAPASGGGHRSDAAASEAKPLSPADATSRVVLFTATRWGNH